MIAVPALTAAVVLVVPRRLVNVVALAAAASATTLTRRRGTTSTTAAVRAGTAIIAAASSSRLVTQRPQSGAIPRAELGKDPLVEHGGHERDENEVERDAELDRNRGAAGQFERRQRERVLDEDDAQDLEQRRA